MKSLSFLAALLIATSAIAQTTPSKLPPANPLPPPGTEEGAVLAPVQRLFAAMAGRNADAILAEVRADGRVTAVSDKVTSVSWTEFADRFRAAGPRLEESLTGSPAIEIDGDIAMIWSDYVFVIDGKLSHCGVDHFDMVRAGGSWKILNITYSSRTTGCPTQ